MSSLSIRGLRKSFGSVVAVRDVSLEIADGSFVTLLGPSGCGKTTTLNLLAGLETPDVGQVFVDDVDVTGHAPHERGMAMVFQSYALYPHKNVFGNLAFSLQLAKVPRAQVIERVRRVAGILEIEDLLDRRVGQLSGGQQQRVSLARALVKEPLVFLFDEPLSNLDAALRVRTRNEIKRLHQRLRTTSVFVTHDQEEAMVLSDHIAVMDSGRVEQFGTPDDVYHRPVSQRVAQFVGKPRMNVVEASVEVDGELVVLTSGAFRLAVRVGQLRLSSRLPERVLVGIRAEEFVLASAASPDPGSGAVSGIVGLVEPLGPDTFIELEVGPHTLTARIDPRVGPVVGDEIPFSVQADRIHLFDAGTGLRLNG